jgi:hypothetical protein
LIYATLALRSSYDSKRDEILLSTLNNEKFRDLYRTVRVVQKELLYDVHLGWQRQETYIEFWNWNLLENGQWKTVKEMECYQNWLRTVSKGDAEHYVFGILQQVNILNSQAYIINTKFDLRHTVVHG